MTVGVASDRGDQAIFRSQGHIAYIKRADSRHRAIYSSRNEVSSISSSFPLSLFSYLSAHPRSYRAEPYLIDLGIVIASHTPRRASIIHVGHVGSICGHCSASSTTTYLNVVFRQDKIAAEFGRKDALFSLLRREISHWQHKVHRHTHPRLGSHSRFLCAIAYPVGASLSSTHALGVSGADLWPLAQAFSQRPFQFERKKFEEP